MRLAIPNIVDGDWESVRIAFQKLASLRLSSDASPIFANLALVNLTANRLVQTNINKKMDTVADGLANQYLRTNGAGNYSWNSILGLGELTLLDAGTSDTTLDTLIFDAGNSEL